MCLAGHSTITSWPPGHPIIISKIYSSGSIQLCPCRPRSAWPHFHNTGLATLGLPAVVNTVIYGSLRDEELKNRAVKPAPSISNFVIPVPETRTTSRIVSKPLPQIRHQLHSHTHPRSETPNSSNQKSPSSPLHLLPCNLPLRLLPWCPMMPFGPQSGIRFMKGPSA